MFERVEVRDFADVYRLAAHFGKQALLAEVTAADPGFDVTVLAQMIGSPDRFDDDEFPLSLVGLPAVRAFFRYWVDELR